MTPVVFSIGSNLGDRLANLQIAVDVVARHGGVTMSVSPVYDTAPVGGSPQPDYLNAVVLATLPPGVDPLAVVRAAEGKAGRERGERWGPRTLDVDVVTLGDVRSDDPTLTLPHPRAAQRAFVLQPWLDLDPDAVLPGTGRVAALLAELDRSGIRRTDLALLVH